jgi:hypothetical protein
MSIQRKFRKFSVMETMTVILEIVLFLPNDVSKPYQDHQR